MLILQLIPWKNTPSTSSARSRDWQIKSGSLALWEMIPSACKHVGIFVAVRLCCREGSLIRSLRFLAFNGIFDAQIRKMRKVVRNEMVDQNCLVHPHLLASNSGTDLGARSDKIAAAALYLASDDSMFFKSRALSIDGGFSAGK